MIVHTIISLGGNINLLPRACGLALSFPGFYLSISDENFAISGKTILTTNVD